MKNFMKEFKDFISRGNVMDMAVGIIIGSAFTAIVTSLVEDIIMPVIGVIIGGVDFTALSVTIEGATIRYGIFLQNIFNFLLIALCVFVMIRTINKMHEKIEAGLRIKKEEAPAPEDPADVALLKEIRDLLKAQNSAE